MGARRAATRRIIGTTPNQAARLQTLAPEGAVVISDDTHEIVRGFFTVESLGRPAMKGIARHVEVFRVIGPTAAVHRLQTEGSSVTRFVGRQAERQRLRERWDAVATVPHGRPGPRRARSGGGGHRQVAARRFVGRRRALGAGKAVLTAFCAPDRQASRLYPIAGMLERAFDLPPATTTRPDRQTGGGERRARARRRHGSLPRRRDRARRRDALRRRARARTARAPRAHVQRDHRGGRGATRARGPTLLLVEDLQWADQTTLELIARLVARPRAPLLILTTARPNFAVDRLPATVK